MQEGSGLAGAIRLGQRLLRTAAARRVARVLEIVPVLLPAMLAAFGLVATVFLLLGQLRSEYVWTVGLAAALAVAAILVRWYPRELSRYTERVVCNLLTFGGVLLWIAFNAYYAGQHIITNRDPGTYANAGAWLIHHDSLQVTATSIFGAVPGISTTSPGFDFSPTGSALMAQGQHLLPIFLGLGGRVVGLAHMFQINVLFGATALLAIYAFTRLLARPFWAMTITGALAASMPFIYFSRDTYSEALAATFTFGALALLWLALESKRLSVWFLAGLVAGAGTLTRIDGYLSIVGLLIFLVILLAITPKAGRRLALRQTGWLVGGMTVAGLVGWRDVQILSTFYYLSTKKQFYPELAAIVAVLAGGAVAVYAAWRTTWLGRLDKMTRRWRSAAGAAAVAGGALLLMSRPFWLHAYGNDDGVPYRTLAELSTEWVAWYIGGVLAVLGVIGIAQAGSRALLKRQPLATAALLVVIGTAVVYLVRPSITPDQIWASRRLMPVILPGTAAFAALALDWASERYLRRLQWGHFYMTVAAIGLVLVPLNTSRPLLLEHDTALLKPFTAACAALPSHAVVLWLGTARTQLIQPTAGICGVPAEGYGESFDETARPSKAALASAAQHAERKGYVPIVGLYGKDANLLPQADRGALTTVVTYAYTRLQQPTITPPEGVDSTTLAIAFGQIEPGGAIVPLRNAN